MKALNEFLRPEFISRVDEVVYFDPLSREDFEKIAVLMLKELVEPLKEREIDFSWAADAVKALAAKAYGGKRGARDLRNTVRREVEDKIAALLVEHSDDAPHTITVNADGDASVRVDYQ